MSADKLDEIAEQAAQRIKAVTEKVPVEFHFANLALDIIRAALDEARPAVEAECDGHGYLRAEIERLRAEAQLNTARAEEWSGMRLLRERAEAAEEKLSLVTEDYIKERNAATAAEASLAFANEKLTQCFGSLHDMEAKLAEAQDKIVTLDAERHTALTAAIAEHEQFLEENRDALAQEARARAAEARLHYCPTCSCAAAKASKKEKP